MSGRIAYYGNIVRDGLVLHLDAAKKDSYPGSGTVWNDLSGNGHNGTLTNGPTYDSANNGTIVFDGTNDYVTNSSLTWTPTTFSVCWFIYPNTRLDFNQGVTALNGWNAFVCHTTANGSIYVGTDIATRLTPSTLGANTLELSKYQYFCFVFNSSRLGIFYKNGVVVGSQPSMTLSTNWGGYVLGSNNTNTINGKLNSVTIYNRALSTAEILQNYNALKGRYGL